VKGCLVSDRVGVLGSWLHCALGAAISRGFTEEIQDFSCLPDLCSHRDTTLSEQLSRGIEAWDFFSSMCRTSLSLTLSTSGLSSRERRGVSGGYLSCFALLHRCSWYIDHGASYILVLVSFCAFRMSWLIACLGDSA